MPLCLALLGRPGGPEGRALQSFRGEAGIAANRHAFAIPYYVAIPQDFHDPQIKRLGSRVSKHTPAARRPSAWAARGPASHTEFPMNSLVPGVGRGSLVGHWSGWR